MNLSGAHLQHFLYFHTVASSGSIKAAAKMLKVTQPAVSLRIKTLEENLDTSLFSREFRKLKLTQAGHTLFEHTAQIFNLTESALIAISDKKRAKRLLKAGFVPSVSMNRVHDILKPLWRKDLILQVSTGTFAELHDQMLHNQLDMMIVDSQPRIRSEWSVREVAQRRLLFVAAPKFKGLKNGFPKSLDGAPFISFTEANAICLQADRFLAANKITPDVVGKIDDTTLLASFLVEGKAVGILSASSAQPLIDNGSLVSLGSMSDVISRLWIVSRQSI